ncbi:MAG: hypothetical protein WA542_16440 [Candidatus Acidiferrum sp.]
MLLAVVLAVMQAGPPVPRKASDSASSTSQSVTKNSGDNKNPTASSPSVVKPVTPNPEQNAGDTPKPENEQHSVAISKLPPVSINAPKRDWADWMLWGFNGLLVIAGFFGIRLAYRTLKTIEKQTKATEDAAKAAQASADAFIAENRPWLLLDKDMTPSRPHTWMQFEPSIRNFGKTPAKVIAFQIEAQIGGRETFPQPEFFKKEEPFSFYILPQEENLSRFIDGLNHPKYEELSRGTGHFWLCGLIRYRDTFESTSPEIYETLFCLRLDPFKDIRPVWESGPFEYNRAT